MAGYRQDRINEQMAQELAIILRTVKDPRISCAFVSITGVQCSPDLKNAKVYFSAFGKDVDLADIKKGLASASGYIRSQLAQNLNLRITPELKFYIDEGMEKGARMNELLHIVEKELKSQDENENENERKNSHGQEEHFNE